MVTSSDAGAQLDSGPGAPVAELELSVVMPCLNEAETLEVCIRKALGCIQANGIAGEVLVADNGSTDGSIEIAERAGARVVHVAEKGYGNALMGGFRAARGRFLIMGDADDSYDFTNLMPFVERLRQGYDVVMGSRFKGGIADGAMPWLHRYVGNPVLTGILNLLFRSGIGDAHCGLRGLTREAFGRLNLRTPGMEFASEMVVKAAARRLRMTEVPTTLSPDGRSRPPHLRSFRDGWRHLRFLLLLAPDWVFIYPGIVVFLVGLLALILLGIGPLKLGSVILDQHTLVAGALMVVVGYQAITIGLAARTFAVQQEIGPPGRLVQWGLSVLRFERGLVIGAALCLVGIGLILALVFHWAAGRFGPLDLASTIRPMVIALVLITVGWQTILTAFLYSMFRLTRPNPR